MVEITTTEQSKIKTIYVEAPQKSCGKRRQKIHIEYDGIGFFPLEKLEKKETA